MHWCWSFGFAGVWTYCVCSEILWNVMRKWIGWCSVHCCGSLNCENDQIIAPPPVCVLLMELWCGRGHVLDQLCCHMRILELHCESSHFGVQLFVYTKHNIIRTGVMTAAALLLILCFITFGKFRLRPSWRPPYQLSGSPASECSPTLGSEWSATELHFLRNTIL